MLLHTPCAATCGRAATPASVPCDTEHTSIQVSVPERPTAMPARSGSHAGAGPRAGGVGASAAGQLGQVAAGVAGALHPLRFPGVCHPHVSRRGCEATGGLRRAGGWEHSCSGGGHCCLADRSGAAPAGVTNLCMLCTLPAAHGVVLIAHRKTAGALLERSSGRMCLPDSPAARRRRDLHLVPAASGIKYLLWNTFNYRWGLSWAGVRGREWGCAVLGAPGALLPIAWLCCAPYPSPC